MRADETRRRLITELKTQFSKTDENFATQIAPDEPVVTFPTPTFEKPNMFLPDNNGRLEMIIDTEIHVIKGIGFKNTAENANVKNDENREIYSMKELITTNSDNMRTISYDEKVVKAQLALVKRREWQDILFEDVDWFKQIDLTTGIKRLFKKI